MQELQISEIAISERGLRDGLLMDYLSRRQPDYWPMSVRLRSVLQLGRTCGYDEAHAQNVAALALELFDSAREAGLHSLGPEEREWLHYAAMLHDVGAFLSYNRHNAHTYYIINKRRDARLRPDRGGHHRGDGAVSPQGLAGSKRAEFAALDRRSQKIVRMLSVLLRIAENLNRGHTNVVRHAFLRAGSGKKITLCVHAAAIANSSSGRPEQSGRVRKRAGRSLTVELVADRPKTP